MKRNLRVWLQPLGTDFSIITAFHAMAGRPGTVFLDSAANHDPKARYSWLATDPLPNDSHEMIKWQPARVDGERLPPFCGGWMGYVGYEAYADFTDRVPSRPTHYPIWGFGYYDTFLFTDHTLGKSWAASLGLAHARANSNAQLAAQHINSLLKLVKQEVSMPKRIPSHNHGAFMAELMPNLTYKQYIADIQKIKSYIAQGDCYQVNYTQRFITQTDRSAAELYQQLRQVSPAAYAAYLNMGPVQILSSSPELYLQVIGDKIQTQPIKGTRPRGLDLKRDARLRHELEQSSKDRAELLMITDLERNDLGRICQPGSVETEALAHTMTLPQLHHLYSTVSGRLRPALSVGDILKACFPGGSITGAPKLRAMQIIRELEDHPREAYTGAIGFIGLNGNMHLSIAIRTLFYEGGQVSLYAGGGIVADSEPDVEYRECLTKIEGILQALHA